MSDAKPLRTFNDRNLIQSDRDKKEDPNWVSRDELIQDLLSASAGMKFMSMFGDTTKYVEIIKWKPITRSLNHFQNVSGFLVKFCDGEQDHEIEVLATVQKPLPPHKEEVAHTCHDCGISSEIITRLTNEIEELKARR